jgi:flagellar biosynthesis/type III secretory pathway chaperone
MTTAAERLALVDAIPAVELCQRALDTLNSLVAIMNEETTLLRAGRAREASVLSAQKTSLAQEYTGLVRSIQRQTTRLLKEAPDEVRQLRAGHERLATQMAENLKVLATARTVAEDILTDVANAVGERNRTRTYGATGEIAEATPAGAAKGIAVNRRL